MCIIHTYVKYLYKLGAAYHFCFFSIFLLLLPFPKEKKKY